MSEEFSGPISEEWLEKITRTSQVPKQRKVLDAAGISYMMQWNNKGISLTWESFNAHLSPRPLEQKVPSTPNFDQVKSR